MKTSPEECVGFLGAGRMATALAGGFVKSGLLSPGQLVASDVSELARQRFAGETGGAEVAANCEVVGRAHTLFLAVKPQNAGDVLRDIAGSFTPSHLLVSIVAGLSLERIAALLPEGSRLIRVMPNTPCLVGAGASAFAVGKEATEEDARRVQRLLSTVGLCVRLEEKHLDAVTGLSGSGPAYVFQIIEALSDAGVRMGLPRDVATQLAAQTVLGAAQMVLQTGEHPGVLKDAVTSPGGTTIAGLHALEQGGLRAALMDAVREATLRSEELGRSS